jgi:bifunctional DNA-binding transcriptional regulator/antitoxin component of YhaV-PrlF toxin-antitoxin module
MKRNVVVDEVGRLVLPKEIREAIGVFGRTSVQVEVVNNIAQLSVPETADEPVERKGNRTVFGGALPENWDSGEAVLKARGSMREDVVRQV